MRCIKIESPFKPPGRVIDFYCDPEPISSTQLINLSSVEVFVPTVHDILRSLLELPIRPLHLQQRQPVAMDVLRVLRLVFKLVVFALLHELVCFIYPVEASEYEQVQARTVFS